MRRGLTTVGAAGTGTVQAGTIQNSGGSLILTASSSGGYITPMRPFNNHMSSHQAHWALAYHGSLGTSSAQMTVGGHLGLAAAYGAAAAIDTRITRVSAGVAAILSSTSTADSTSLGQLNAGLLDATAPAATDIPLSITGAAAQSANLFNITSNGGTAGDLLSVDSAGDATFGGDLALSSPTVPASAAATGVAGTVSWAAGYVYICTATDTWKRVAIATW